MIPVVVVSVLLLSSTIALPLTTQEHETSQIQTGTPLNTFQQQVEKTGVQTSEIYPQGTQTGFNGVSQQYTQVEKTGLQTPTEVQTNQEHTQQNVAVPKVEPVNAEQSYSNQSPVLLPVQPLSVVPVNPTNHVLRPIVVPVEAIVDGRVIISPIGSSQQRNFQQEVFAIPENHQQVFHPTTYTVEQTQVVEPNQQPYFVQPVEEQTLVQQQTQDYTPVQVYSNQELNNEQPTNVVKQTAEPVQEYHQVPVNTYSQNVQQVVPETPEKQVTYEVPTGQVPLQSNPQQQVYNVQEPSEKQVPYQQTEYTQNQAYSAKPVAVENVEKQVPYQQTTGYQTQNVETYQQQVYNPQQTVEKQGQYQYHQTEQQQNIEKQGQYQPQYSQSQQQLENVEKQVPVPTADYVPVQTHSVQPVHQPQVYSVQPVQVETQVPYHQVNQQPAQAVPEHKTSEFEPNQQHISVQPQQVYVVEPVHNFGDKLPQVQHHTLSAVPHSQYESSVQPSVGSTQE